MYAFGVRSWLGDFGIGMNFTYSSELSPIFATNLYYRVVIGSRVALFFGTGISKAIDDSVDNLRYGYDCKLGTEVLIGRIFSISAIVTWDTIKMFSYYDTNYSTETPELRMVSVSLQENFYLF